MSSISREACGKAWDSRRAWPGASSTSTSVPEASAAILVRSRATMPGTTSSMARPVSTRFTRRTASTATAPLAGRAASRHTGAWKNGPCENRSAHSSFAATAHPARSRKGYPGSLGLTTANAGGSPAGGLWWSTTIVSMPSPAASSISAWLEMPQSTVMIRPVP